jgi:hypothetical protein
LKQEVYRKVSDKFYTLLQGLINRAVVTGTRIWDGRPRNLNLNLIPGREENYVFNKAPISSVAATQRNTQWIWSQLQGRKAAVD